MAKSTASQAIKKRPTKKSTEAGVQPSQREDDNSSPASENNADVVNSKGEANEMSGIHRFSNFTSSVGKFFFNHVCSANFDLRDHSGNCNSAGSLT